MEGNVVCCKVKVYVTSGRQWVAPGRHYMIKSCLTYQGYPTLGDSRKYRYLCMAPQRSNAARVRNMSRFNGGKNEAVPGKRSFKCWVSVETILFVYLGLYCLVLCFITVFLAKLSYKFRYVNVLKWHRFSRHWQPDVTQVFAFDCCEMYGSMLRLCVSPPGPLNTVSGVMHLGLCCRVFNFNNNILLF